MTLAFGNLNSAPTVALKSATNDLHRQVEQSIDWQALLGNLASYQQFLREICRFLSPPDRLLRQFFGETESWITTRRTTDWARADLHDLVLRRTGNVKQASDEVAAIDDHAADDLYAWVERPSQAAGMLYVLEGSTMGSVHLCKIVTSRIGPSMEVPVRFLTAYGDQTGNHWRQTKQWLDAFLRSETDVASAIEAACRMFQIYGEQLSRGK